MRKQLAACFMSMSSLAIAFAFGCGAESPAPDDPGAGGGRGGSGGESGGGSGGEGNVLEGGTDIDAGCEVDCEEEEGGTADGGKKDGGDAGPIAIPTNGLVLYLPFDKDIDDKSASNATCTNHGAVAAAD